jgi:hypothetical protein
MLRPTEIFEGYQSLANGAAAPAAGIFIPLTSLPGLTEAEANASTGDGRKLAFELALKMLASHDAIPLAGRSPRFSVSTSPPTGISSTTVRRSFTFNFEVDISTADVAND